MSARKIVCIVGPSGSGMDELYEATNTAVNSLPQDNGVPDISIIGTGTVIKRRLAYDDELRKSHEPAFRERNPLPDEVIHDLLSNHSGFRSDKTGNLIIIGFPMNIEQFTWLQRNCFANDAVCMAFLNSLQSSRFARLKRAVSDLSPDSFKKAQDSEKRALGVVNMAVTKAGHMSVQINADRRMSEVVTDVLAHADVNTGTLRKDKTGVSAVNN